ncbi:MAG: hypothetical protein WHS46_06685 [Desulfosoma sp.]
MKRRFCVKSVGSIVWLLGLYVLGADISGAAEPGTAAVLEPVHVVASPIIEGNRGDAFAAQKSVVT